MDEFESSTLDLEWLISEVKQDDELLLGSRTCQLIMSTLLDPKNALLLEPHPIEVAKEFKKREIIAVVSDLNADDATTLGYGVN